MERTDSLKPKKEIGQVLRYVVVGVFTSLLDLSIFSALAVLLHVAPTLANVVSTVITICVSYLINSSFVFQARKLSWASFFSFAGLTLFTGLVIQSLVIWAVSSIAFSLAGQSMRHVILPGSKVAAMAIGAVCNYLGYRFIFKKSK